MAKTLEAMAEPGAGLIFVNLVDFDQQYGHRNDVEGYGAALEQFDAWLPEFEAALRPATWPSSPPTTAATRPFPAPITRASTSRCWPSAPKCARGVDLGLARFAFRYRPDRGREFRRLHRSGRQLLKGNQIL
jgi:hypothetical protein